MLLNHTHTHNCIAFGLELNHFDSGGHEHIVLTGKPVLFKVLEQLMAHYGTSNIYETSH